MRRKDFVGVINSVDVEDKMWCPRCIKRGHNSQLKEQVIIDPSKPLSPDYDQFKQCHRCGLIVPLYNVRHEGELYSDLDIVENPFDFGNAQIKGTEDMKYGIKGRYQQLKSKQNLSKNKDKEVAKLEDSGAVVSNYNTTM